MKDHTTEVYVNPNETISVEFCCTKCEAYRHRAVSPARHVRCAIDAMDKGNTTSARGWMEMAMKNLEVLAQWAEDTDE